MKNTGFLLMTAAVIALALGVGCSSGKAPSETIDPAKLAAFSALPADAFPAKQGAITDDKIALGRMLYYDKRFSKSQTISCNSCHLLDQYGVDGKPTSEGHKGQRGDRNAPTVYNAAGTVAQFWDGRAPDVEEQAKGPVLNPVEMAMAGEKTVLQVINSMPEYVAAFKKAFPEDKNPVTYDNFGKAIGAFERKLVTPSRWDKFLKGDQAALTAEEKAGFLAFADAGCGTCHSGALVGGQMFQKAGLVKPWPNQADPGRFKVTKSDADKMMFKVPTLRNIEKTGPYFHDGKTPTLVAAISAMAEHQLGKTLTDAQVKSIETWMKALTGDIPAQYIKEPELPKSTAKTPKPSTAD
jgi:cytochrome c peroxidase